MKTISLLVAAIVLLAGTAAQADTFGTGGNQFTIDFVTISGDASSANGTNISGADPGHSWYKAFSDPGNFRIAVYEVTNDQWDKFKDSLGVPVTGSDGAYDANPWFFGANVPTNNASWFEAAQFVNWLNTSTGHHAAYKFTGTQGTSDYALDTWGMAEADNGVNLYRHKDAVYYLPAEDEWVKAGYWNGSDLQTYATKTGETLFQGNGGNGGWNYWDGDSGPDGSEEGPWAVGSGSEELNGTYDMMGNVFEWMEGLGATTTYAPSSPRGLLGGPYNGNSSNMTSYNRNSISPYTEDNSFGFRVASEIPEPATLSLLTVTKGSGSGIYAEGEVVPISADPVTPGMVFDEWAGDTSGVADVEASDTTITMPNADATVTATYTHDGDLNKDGIVNIVDLNMVLIAWGKSGAAISDPRTDVYADGTIDIADLNVVLIDWGQTAE